MLVAGFMVHASNGLTGEGGYQWALLLGAAAFALMMDGAGRYSCAPRQLLLRDAVLFAIAHE